MSGEKVINVVPIEAIVSVTELTIHLDRALFVQNAIAFFSANAFKSSKCSFPGTAAAKGDGLCIEQPQSFLVKQPVKQSLAIEGKQFLGFNGTRQVIEPVPKVFILLGIARQFLQHQPRTAVFIGE